MLAESYGADPNLPPVQLFVPGFVVHELLLQLTNQNNVQYAPDGRLFAAGFDGRVHLLRDTDGDGLEDTAVPIVAQTSGDYALGMAWHRDALYIVFRHEIARFRDADGDGLPETREVAATGFDNLAPEMAARVIKRRVDYALGLAIAPDGTFYLSMGNAAYNKPYLLEKGVSHYSPALRRGCVLRISADGKQVEQIASGVRYLVSMQLNRAGDLFATDQEGATWLPNGNAFDELLHLETGRHYGFPARHPKYLPDVIDEPSVFDYGPQHQSLCGFRFNESGHGRARFGPASWEGDALITAMGRGKLYRTQLVKTAAGYIAQNHLIAGIQALAVDCTISPRGDLIVAAHTGKPDWGSGPQGIGRLFKITHAAPDAPQPVLAYAASPTQTHIEFDRPLTAAWRDAAARIAFERGRYVAAGDRFEKQRGRYVVVQNQLADPRLKVPLADATLAPDGRTLVLRHAAQTSAVSAAISLPDPARARLTAGALAQEPALDIAFDLTGLAAEWTPHGAEAARWSGWLPHPDLKAARAFTTGSAAHEPLQAAMEDPGTLRMRGQLDLDLMLRPAVQHGAKLDHRYEPETVTVVFASATPLSLTTNDRAKLERIDAGTVRLTTTTPAPWLAFDLAFETGGATPATLEVHWFTAEDPRPRALPLRRFLLPWAQPVPLAAAAAAIPEIAGGDWAAGRKLYFGAAACSVCHSIREEGGAVGPDLSNLVHRDYAGVRRDIEDPNATLNPDHLGYVVEFADGSSLAGVIASDTPPGLKITSVAGETTVIPRVRIKSVVPMKTSLMPPGLLQALAPDDVRDLMTFLLRATSAPK